MQLISKTHNTFVDYLLVEDMESARKIFHARLAEILASKLNTFKAQIALRDFASGSNELNEYMQNVTRRQGRLNFVRIRVRRGKVQRRKKFSAVKGYTLRGGRLIRMKPAERLHRRLAARRAKIKRRVKHSQILRKTRIAMRKRRSLGLRAWSANPVRR